MDLRIGIHQGEILIDGEDVIGDDVMVSISIYDMNGNVVMDLLKDHQTSGHRSAQWNGTNNEGQTVSAGVYLYKVQIGDMMQTKKMVLLK